MTREEAKELMPVIQAFADGKDVETKTGSGWMSIENMSFAGKPDAYRIKPEQKYRSFRNAEECLQEMLKHQPFGWIKAKEGGYQNIVSVDNCYADTAGSSILLDSKNSYQDNTFFDGTPFGIKVEE